MVSKNHQLVEGHSPLHRDDPADPQVNGHSILVSDSVGSTEVEIIHHLQNYTFNYYIYYAFEKCMTFQSIFFRIISFSTIVATGVSEGRSCHDETLGKPLGGGRQGGGGEGVLSNHVKSYHVKPRCTFVC